MDKGAKRNRGTAASPRGVYGADRPAHALPTSGSVRHDEPLLSPTSHRSSMSMHAPPSVNASGKILLPPLHKQGQVAGKGAEKNRTSHACERCRQSKSKCTGGQPCDKCKNESRECIYGDGKRDRDKRELQVLRNRTRRLETQVQRFAHQLTHLLTVETVTESDLVDARLVLSEYLDGTAGSDGDVPDREGGAGRARYMRGTSSTSNGEDFADADVGSTGSLDAINEDTNRNEYTRAAGYMGKSSAVTWVQRAREQAKSSPEENPGLVRSDNSYVAASYHAEEKDIPKVDANAIDPFEMPPPEVASALVDSYFLIVHPSFPVLNQEEFMTRFNTRSTGFRPSDPAEQDWLCTINLVLAIAAKYAHLTNAVWKGDEDDHLKYHSRANQLGIESRTLIADSNLTHTTCLALLGLYYLTTDQLNRAWMITGFAIRSGITLGLHVRSEAQIPDIRKEMRVRLWWTTYNLERVLNAVLGRPSAISNKDISTPMPLNVDESRLSGSHDLSKYRQNTDYSEMSSRTMSAIDDKSDGGPLPSAEDEAVGSASPSSPPKTSNVPSIAYTFSVSCLTLTSSTFYIYHTQLSIISHEILSELYCATLVKAKWTDVQQAIFKIDERLRRWKQSLPEQFDFSLKSHDPDDGHDARRKGLEILYNSARMTLFRSCLCRFQGRIKGESDWSKSFNASAVEQCVKAARSVVDALPDQKDSNLLYAIVPWWTIIHHIIEAGSILMLELAYRAEHVPSQAEYVLQDAKKTVSWLSVLAERSVAARKGWEIFSGLLQNVAPKVGADVSDVPVVAPTPPNWQWNRFGTNSKMSTLEGGAAEFVPQNQLMQPGQQYETQTSTANSSWTAGANPYESGADFNARYQVILQPFATQPFPYGMNESLHPWNTTIYPSTSSFAYADTPVPGLASTTGVDMQGLQIVGPQPAYHSQTSLPGHTPGEYGYGVVGYHGWQGQHSLPDGDEEDEEEDRYGSRRQ